MLAKLSLLCRCLARTAQESEVGRLLLAVPGAATRVVTIILVLVVTLVLKGSSLIVPTLLYAPASAVALVRSLLRALLRLGKRPSA